MRKQIVIAVLRISILVLVISPARSQNRQQLNGSVERIKVHGQGLEKNLEGDDPDRNVSVYLPPGYKKNTNKRYPVIYSLHGYTDDDAKWYGFVKHWINLPAIVDSIFVKDAAKEMIIVTPNAYTQFQGSMYSNSITTGNWEDYISKELVSYMDTHYRTMASTASRGLAGHSMGGYGTLRIGEKHPEVFGSIYMLSPCCLAPDYHSPDSLAIAKTEAIKSFTDFEKADFMTKISFASAAAWSPDPTNPPLYLQLPFSGGQAVKEVQAKWIANRPLANLDQNIYNLKRLRAIGFDAGDRDEGIASAIKILDKELNKYQVPHAFSIYAGTHTNRIGERIRENMIPFFATNLSFNDLQK